ncbi:putative holin-like toxin [Streptococcus henryi]|uniref:putative holin-like toxin n=1 Tax=Streptococcus henryi TaxID=439219 RepID=UPI00114D45D7
MVKNALEGCDSRCDFNRLRISMCRCSKNTNEMPCDWQATTAPAMSVYEALALMINSGIFLLALLAYLKDKK